MLPSLPTCLKLHVTEVNQRLLTPDEGLLLGNGDLSVSVYQTADRIIWRLGKGDVWDRRFDGSEDAPPLDIEEMRRGAGEEKWKADDHQPITAETPTTTPERLKQVSLHPSSYQQRPYPCPKPVGELCLQLPLNADLVNVQVNQRLVIEEGRLELTYTWPNGRELKLESFIHPERNVLVVHWQVKECPVWFSLYRWADPTEEAYAARLVADTRNRVYRVLYHSPKATPLAPPEVRSGYYDGVGGQFIEQAFAPDPLFPEGFRYWLVPFVSNGTIEAVDMKPLQEARLVLLPETDATEGWMTVTVPTSSDQGGVTAECQRLREAIYKDPAATMQIWREETVQAGQEFWGRSGVSIEDPVMEDTWYRVLHARRCFYKAGKIPPGLYPSPIIGDYSVWHGDYHWNYNFQAPFWGNYEANQLEVGDAYFKTMEYALQMGRLIAERYYHSRGAFIQLTTYPLFAEDDVFGIGPLARMVYMTGWAVQPYWWRYRFTMDKAWLRDTGYPVIKELALFCNDFLRKGEDGLYHAFPSIEEEKSWTGNPADYTDQGQVLQHLRYCLRVGIWASQELGVDEDLWAEWQEHLDHMVLDPVAFNGVQYDGTLTGLAKHCEEVSEPQFGIGKPFVLPGPRDASAPSPIVGRIGSWWLGHPGSALTALRDGSFLPERDYYEVRKFVQTMGHINGLFYGRHDMGYQNFVFCEELAILAPVQEMMLQSWDGILRIFPGWPREVPASFRTLRAQGALLVSASWANGEVAAAEVFSEAGAPCRVYAPWPQGVAVTDDSGQAVTTQAQEGGVFRFETQPGRTYRLSRPR